jgi:hypothetical protein
MPRTVNRRLTNRTHRSRTAGLRTYRASMKRASALILAILLLTACAGGAATVTPTTAASASATPAASPSTTPTTMPIPTPVGSPTPAPGAMGTCRVDVVVSGGLSLTLPDTMPAQLGWSGDPFAWGISAETSAPIDVPMADGTTLPMTVRLSVADQDGAGPGEADVGIILVGPMAIWPSPLPGGTPPPGSRKMDSVFINLYWTRNPQPTQSFPPGEGAVTFRGRFAATVDVTFPFVQVSALFVPSTSVVSAGDISAQGSVSCE